ncbi:MAG: hypothetical protein K6G10_02700 [Butyrivibrio sp.]|nr:hypothetical protein [Butyrivibrio sp.]
MKKTNKDKQIVKRTKKVKTETKTASKKKVSAPPDIIIDDTEDENASLVRQDEKENVFKTNDIRERNLKVKKVNNIVIRAVAAALGLIALVFVVLIIKRHFFGPEDDKMFYTDNPEDPLSYSNISKSFDEDSILPIYKFTVQGKYSAFDEQDVNQEFSFTFDPSGYFEGYSSYDKDDYGIWDMTSDGENYYIVTTCSEAEDKYTVELMEDGMMLLTGKDRAFTLTPVKE